MSNYFILIENFQNMENLTNLEITKFTLTASCVKFASIDIVALMFQLYEDTKISD